MGEYRLAKLLQHRLHDTIRKLTLVHSKLCELVETLHFFLVLSLKEALMLSAMKH